MPRLKKPDIPHVKLRRLILGYELSTAELARIIGCCESTALKKMKNPGFFTVEDLMRISRLGHIPIDEIRAAIS